MLYSQKFMKLHYTMIRSIAGERLQRDLLEFVTYYMLQFACYNEIPSPSIANIIILFTSVKMF